MRLWSALLLGLVAAAPPSHPGVIGYVEEGRFHPLLVVEAAQFRPFDARSTGLVGGVLRDAFADGGAEFLIQAERAYADRSGEPAKYGVAPGRSYESLFFELNRGAKPRPAAAPSPELAQSLLRFLADDERSADLRALYATDLDGDGRKELWVAYRLPDGRRGRMVWEQRSAPGAWVELADRCYDCASEAGPPS